MCISDTWYILCNTRGPRVNLKNLLILIVLILIVLIPEQGQQGTILIGNTTPRAPPFSPLSPPNLRVFIHPSPLCVSTHARRVYIHYGRECSFALSTHSVAGLDLAGLLKPPVILRHRECNPPPTQVRGFVSLHVMSMAYEV